MASSKIKPGRKFKNWRDFFSMKEKKQKALHHGTNTYGEVDAHNKQKFMDMVTKLTPFLTWYIKWPSDEII